jgi:Fe-S cluster assembly ATPase SufC
MNALLNDFDMLAQGQRLKLAESVALKPGAVRALVTPCAQTQKLVFGALSGLNVVAQSLKCELIVEGSDLCQLPLAERSRGGQFIHFKNGSMPPPGIKVLDYLRRYTLIHDAAFENFAYFQASLKEAFALLGIGKETITEPYDRQHLNEDTLEKLDRLQWLLANPRLVLLDETDACLLHAPEWPRLSQKAALLLITADKGLAQSWQAPATLIHTEPFSHEC